MRVSVRKMAVAGVLGAVSIVMGLVPWLGFIPVPGPVPNATILHVPAILAGVTEGPVVGMTVGFIFGLMSLLRSTSAAFADPLIAVLPRLFIGVFAAWSFTGLRRFGLIPALVGSAIVGTLTNTGLVLSSMVLRGYLAPGAAWLVAGTNGVAEVIVASIVCTAVGGALFRAGFLRRVPSSSEELA